MNQSSSDTEEDPLESLQSSKKASKSLSKKKALASDQGCEEAKLCIAGAGECENHEEGFSVHVERQDPRQHVDLRPIEGKGNTHRGRTVHFWAKLEWQPKGKDFDEQYVHWYVVAGGSNAKGEDVDAAELEDCEDDKLHAITGVSEDGDTGIKLHVSDAHGDTFEVWATLRDDFTGGVCAGKLVVERTATVVEKIVEVDSKNASVKDRPTRQYVCRERDEEEPDEHLDYGPTIRVRARLAWRQGREAGPITGQKVYFYFKGGAFDKGNDHESATPGFELVPESGPKEHVETTVDKDGWTAPVLFHFSPDLRNSYKLYATEEPTYERGKSLPAYTVHDAPDVKLRVVAIAEVHKDDSPYPRDLSTKEAPGGGRRQYVNLTVIPAGDVESPEQGPVLRLRARVEPRGNRKLARAVRGQHVYWHLTHLERAAQAGPAQAASFSGVTGTDMGDGVYRVPIGDDGWSDPVTVRIRGVGGDRITFGAGTDGAQPKKVDLEVGPFEVWRKLWFQVSAMATSSKGRDYFDLPHDHLPDCFRGAFIEMEREGGVHHFAHQEITRPDSHLLDFAKSLLRPAKVPFKCHVVGVDRLVSTRDETIDLEATGTKLKIKKAAKDLAEDGIREAHYKAGSTWRTLDKGLITVDKDTLLVDLSGLKTAPTSKAPVPISLKLRYWSETVAGITTDYPHTFIELGHKPLGLLKSLVYDVVEKTPKQLHSAVAHEIGHTLTMVPASSPDYDPVNTNGGHCKNKCIMWFQMVPDPAVEFCKTCSEILMTGVDFDGVKRSYERNC